MMPMLAGGGGGGTAAASLLAGNVFLATANPATLMTIGTGVGSAVMGPRPGSSLPRRLSPPPAP